MKKITCILYLLLSFTLCFVADFKVIRNTKIYDGDYNYIGDLKKGQIVQLFDRFISNQNNNDKLNFDYSVRLNIDGKKRLVDACSIIPAETKDLFDNSVNYMFLCKDNKKYISNKGGLTFLPKNEDFEGTLKEYVTTVYNPYKWLTDDCVQAMSTTSTLLKKGYATFYHPARFIKWLYDNNK